MANEAWRSSMAAVEMPAAEGASSAFWAVSNLRFMNSRASTNHNVPAVTARTAAVTFRAVEAEITRSRDTAEATGTTAEPVASAFIGTLTTTSLLLWPGDQMRTLEGAFEP